MFTHLSQFASAFTLVATAVALIYALNTFNLYPLILSLVFMVAAWVVTGIAKRIG